MAEDKHHGLADKLTAKQETACLKYLECGDKSKAYRHAYNTENMKPETINRSAHELFEENPKITARMKELRAGIEKRTEITVDRVLNELALLGFANMLDYVRITDGGEPFINLSDLTREQAAAISETLVEDYFEGRGEDARQVRKVKIKFYDKRAALEAIGKHLGMFKDVLDHTGAITLTVKYDDDEPDDPST